jgi:hypothetical protein
VIKVVILITDQGATPILLPGADEQSNWTTVYQREDGIGVLHGPAAS